MSAITNAAASLARADAQFTSAVNEVARSVALALGDDCTHDEWEQGHEEFVEAYTRQRGCQVKTAENRWSFVVAEMGAQFAMEKPRKPTKEAARKAEKRSNEAEQVDAAIAQHGTLRALTKAFAEASPDEAPILIKAMEKKRKAEDKVAVTIAKETVKAQRDQLRKMIAKINSIKGLEALIKLAEKFAPVEDSEASSDSEAGDDETAAVEGIEVVELDGAPM